MRCKRTLCSLLASVMLAASLPVTALAATEPPQNAAVAAIQAETETASEQAAAQGAAQDSTNTLTNNGGNLMNGGRAAVYQDTIYYSNLEDGGCLYAKTGTSEQKLTTYAVQYLNVYGDDLFYTCMDGEQGLSQIGVYRPATGENHILFTVELQKGIKNLVVEQGFCYYISDGMLYRLSLQTGERELLLHGKTGVTAFLLFAGGYAYSRMAEDGTSPLTVYQYDTMQETVVADHCSSFDIADGRIYYADPAQGGALYRVQLDGKQREKLTTHGVDHIVTSQEQVYFKDAGTTGVLQVLDTETGEIQEEGAGACTDFAVLDTEQVMTATAEVLDTDTMLPNDTPVNPLQIGRLASNTTEYKTWKQYDSRWGDFAFANGETIAQSGCLVTSIAMCIMDAGVPPTKYKDSFDPGVFFDLMNNNGGFTASGALYWYVVETVIPKFTLKTWGESLSQSSASEKIAAIKKYTDQGMQVVVNVNYGGHWVAVDPSRIVSGNNGYVGIFDPGYDIDNLFGAGGYSLKSVVALSAYSVKGVTSNQSGTNGDDEDEDETLIPYKVNASNVNYRSTASIDATPLGTLSKGTAVNVVQGGSIKADGYTFYKVRMGSKYYYVVKDYLTKLQDIEVTSVTLDRSKATLYENGSALTLKATIAPDNATDQGLQWTSSDTAVAKVSSSGKVTPIAEGTATITVRADNGKKDTCTITVKEEQLVTYKVSADSVNYRSTAGTDGAVKGTLKQGDTVQVVSGYSVTADGYTWYKFKKSGNYYYVAKKYLSEIAVTKIKLNRTTASISEDATLTLTATISPSNASDPDISWSSSDTSVAKVSSSGKVTGVAPGKATIKATASSGKTASCTVTVKELEMETCKATTELNYRTAPSTSASVAGTLAKGTSVKVVKDYSTKADSYTWYKLKIDGKYYYAVSQYLSKASSSVAVTKVTLNHSTATLKEDGDTISLKATVTPSNATDAAITWSSSDTDVAKVSSSGKVTAVQAGTATITAKTKNGKKDTCKVTVTKETLLSYHTTDDLTYRSAPSLQGASKGVLPKGTAVKVVKGSSTKADAYTWYQIKIDGKYYYAVSAFLSKTATASNTATATVALSQTSATLYVGGNSLKLSATVTTVSRSAQTVTWKSSNPAIAKVSSSGTITPLKAGTVTITAQLSSGKKATCKVTVQKETLVNKKTTDALCYRASPSLTGTKKGELAKGTTVKVVKGYQKKADALTWYKIKYGGKYYYVAAKYLKSA